MNMRTKGGWPSTVIGANDATPEQNGKSWEGKEDVNGRNNTSGKVWSRTTGKDSIDRGHASTYQRGMSREKNTVAIRLTSQINNTRKGEM